MTPREEDALWEAWSLLNSVNARDGGAGMGWSSEFLTYLVDRLEGMIPLEYRKPWHPCYTRRRQNDPK